MAQRLIHRPARTRPEDPDLHPVELIPPPTLPDAAAGLQGVMGILMPIMGGAGSLVMIVANRNPVMLIAGGLMLSVTVLGAIVMFVAQRTGSAKKASDLRRRYLEYLDRVRDELTESGGTQLEIARHHHPPPDALVEVARDPLRIWERRPHDPDFLLVRVGTGTAPLWQRVLGGTSRDPLVEPDVVTAAAVHRIVSRDRMVGNMPVCLPLAGRVSVVGPIPAIRRTVTAALAQLVTLHGPEEVRVVLCAPRRLAGWLDWLKWMPHALSEDQVDGTAPRRLVADDAEALGGLLAAELSRRVGEVTRGARLGGLPAAVLGPAIVVVVDGTGGARIDPLAGLPPEVRPADIGVHCLTLVSDVTAEPERVDIRLTCEDDSVTITDRRPVPEDDSPEGAARRRLTGATEGRPDALSPASLDALVRELTAVRLVEESASAAPLESTLDLADLLGVPDVATFDPLTTWAPRPMPDFLRVPFALGPTGAKVHLDIKENALGGMGPHGLCVGATGSGKSEVLRTIVLAMAISHPPERLALVLVDYKGGATFAGLEDLPHCAAMISNLSDDTGLVDRLHDALFGEMRRRQQMLADAGNLPNVTEYNRRRDALLAGGERATAGAGREPPEPLPPLPNLFVVIDEFGELLTAKPDFIELFLAIGRIGRSIGVHLMLASQRLEEGRLRGLESYLSYRLGLRTFNAAESRTVLGVPDAYELPPIPGSGYLKVDTTVFERFKAGYVSGVYRPPATGETVVDAAPIAAPFPLFNDIAGYLAEADSAAGRQGAVAGADADADARDALAPTVLDVAVRRLAAAGRRTGQIWLPPLPAQIELDGVAGEVVRDPVAGLRLDGPGGHGHAVIGLLDKPAEQKQEPLLLDTFSSGGHLAIVGAPQSGKSVLVRTLLTSLALTHLPGEVAFYCLDLGGGALRVLDGLPHLAGIAPRLDADRVRRTIAEVATAVGEREELFARIGIDSVEAMRDRWRAGRLTQLPVCDIYLVIDNYPVLRSEFEDLTDVVQDLATRGPGYGIHLVLTCGRWADVRMQLQAAIGTRIELRINDPVDSSISRKAAENLRPDTPGRAITEDGLQVQVALPALRADRPVGSPAEGALAGPVPPDGMPADPTAALIGRIAASWPGDPVPPIRMLPGLVLARDVPRAPGKDSRVVIGLDGNELRPVGLDLLGGEPHLLAIGDAETGKTSLLRLIIDDLIGRFTDDEVVFAVFDVRRTLLDVVPDDYLGAYAGTAAVAQGMAAAVAGELQGRLPPDDVTAAALRARSWWKGPEIVVIADDYDLLSPGGPGPLAPFVEYLPQARDLGFHLVLARRSGGAGRAMYEPVPQRMREVGATGLLFSGDRGEGALFPGASMSVLPAGRAQLVRRGRKPHLIQVSYLPDPAAQ
jgi:S-DNA-T family DNA segregation ATPase FtsK/SpoIIIE